jgi:hypothetical protein
LLALEAVWFGESLVELISGMGIGVLLEAGERRRISTGGRCGGDSG